MAELLIMAQSARHPNPGKDREGCYKRGDPVQVFDDRRCNGRMVQLPASQGGPFVVIKVPGVTARELEASFIRTHRMKPDAAHTRDNLPTLRCRRLTVALPDGDGPFTMTLEELHALVRDKTL